jgi:hypothetical protein
VASRRWYIDHRAELAAAVRRKYARNRAYRKKKIAAARRQTKRLTTAKKGELAERRCMLRSLTRDSWNKIFDAQPTILDAWQIENASYIIIEASGKLRRERWPPNDLAQFWIADAASGSQSVLSTKRRRWQ